MTRTKWSIPAVLTVQALAFGCPGRETGDSTDTVASSESTGGPVDCASMQQAECDASPRCAYAPELGGCVLDCAVLDEADCTAVPHCVWLGSQCDFEPVA